MGILEGILYMMWRGIAVGIIMSAPMGPVGILCIQRTLEKGRATGFFTGVGAAISDLVYCLLTGFCLSFIEEFLKANQNLIQIIGSVVLIAFGVYLFRSNPARSLKKPDAERVSKRKNILSGFLFTFSNPLIVFLVIGLFARFNFLLPEISLYQYLIGYLFIFVGALLWWYVVTLFVDKVRAHFNLRSMWLINKITGGIIMVFAVVGIVTAITAYANAASPQGRQPVLPYFLNQSRGFDGEIANPGPDTLFYSLPAGGGDWRISFRVASLNNAARRSYPFTDSEGRRRKASHPEWGMRLGSDGGAWVSFRTIDDVGDDLRPARVRMKVADGSGESVEKDLVDVLDPFEGDNAFLLQRSGGVVTLKGGHREYRPLCTFDLADAPDSIGFFLLPGGRVRLSEVSAEGRGEAERGSFTSYGNEDMIRSRLLRSSDPLEGIWVMYDRTLDETQLRPGGDYRLALLKAPGGGYEMIYLGGAVRNGSAWEPGMLRGRVMPAAAKGVYDVEWIGADFRPLPSEGKAQLETRELLTIQFPSLGSSIRLKREE